MHNLRVASPALVLIVLSVLIVTTGSQPIAEAREKILLEPAGVCNEPSSRLEPGWLVNGKEKVFEGETVRYLLGEMTTGGTGRLAPLMDRLQKVRLFPCGDHLDVTIYYDDKFLIPIRDAGNTANFKLSGIEVPKVSSFRLRVKNEIISIRQMTRSGFWLLKVKLPMLPLLTSNVYLRGGSLRMSDGVVETVAGVLFNGVTLVARAQFKGKAVRFDGIRFWEGIADDMTFGKPRIGPQS